MPATWSPRAKVALIAVLFGSTPAVSRTTVPDLSFESKNPVSLIELFTSEGCSSCPPADAWYVGLKSSGKLWRDFVPVAFHVDYWDYLGWKDSLSQESFSSRHQDYGSQWRAGSVFTPSVVVNGKLWPKWRSERQPPLRKGNSGTLKLDVSASGAAKLTFVGSAPKCLVAHFALLALEAKSKVTAGENRGQTLIHAFGALSLESAPMIAEGSQRSLKKSVQLVGSEAWKGKAIAAWISACDDMTPLQAIGGPLQAHELDALSEANHGSPDDPGNGRLPGGVFPPETPQRQTP